MNAVLVVFLLYFFTVCDATKQRQREYDRYMPNPSRPQYGPAPLVQQQNQNIRPVVNQLYAQYPTVPPVQQQRQNQNARTVVDPPRSVTTPAAQRQNQPIGDFARAEHAHGPFVEHEYAKYTEPLGWKDDQQLLQQRKTGNQEAQVKLKYFGSMRIIFTCRFSVPASFDRAQMCA